jgi:hypothetical protein
VAALYCSCEQKPQSWGEFWWTGEEHKWAYFDDRETSETYTERITHCAPRVAPAGDSSLSARTSRR